MTPTHRLLLIGLTLLALLAPTAASANEDESVPGSLLLVLDSSGSMKEPDASGTSKIEAAKQALHTVVDDLPQDAHAGLRVYGATVFDKSKKGACTDSQLVVPVGPADKPALKKAISRHRPYGETPISYSLRQAAQDLGTEGSRTIILVSDSEETCDPDPCAVAREIHAEGIDLRIDVVGLHVDARARRQLHCIADAGGGTYYDAKDSDDLSASLDQSALRAFKDFAVSGVPVEGGLRPGEAPAIGPGQYTDTIARPSQPDGRVKYYMLHRSPGATLHAAVTSRPESRSGSAAASEALKLQLYTPDGTEECAWASGAAFSHATTRDFLNASVFQGPHGNSSSTGPEYIPDACKGTDRLLLKVERQEEEGSASGREDPMELLVTEEPRVDDVERLPEPVEEEDIDQGALPAGAGEDGAEGGGGFADATTLTPGNRTGTLQPGEQLFYRVRADWGQTAAVTFRFPQNPALGSRLGRLGERIKIFAYGPDRSEIFLPGGTDANFTGTTRSYSQDQVFHATLPEVRYRNRENHSDAVRPVSLSGYYYFAIQQNADDEGRKYQEDFEISVAVKGERSGVPAFNEPPAPAATKAGAPGRTENSPQADGVFGSMSPVAVAGSLAGILALCGAALAALLLRRPRRSTGTPPRPPFPPSQ